MKISFVIPTRNQASFIRRCIDSCLAQTIDAEVLVVDGVSTDGTQDVLASYGDRIRWVSERDSGQGEALDKGVRMASGEVIAWINSDDYYPDSHVLKMVSDAFEADPTLDILYGDGDMVDVDGKPIRRRYGVPAQSARDVICIAAPPMLQPAAFFRRSLYLDVGGIRTDLHLALDYDLWIRMWERARTVRYVPQTLAMATHHEDAKTARALFSQVNELTRLKLAHGRRIGMGPKQWAKTAFGVVSLYVYCAAVRSGLRQQY